MLVKMVRNNLSYIVDENVKWHGHFTKTVLPFLTNKNIKLLYGPAIAQQFLREIKTYIHIKTYLNVHSNFVCNS